MWRVIAWNKGNMEMEKIKEARGESKDSIAKYYHGWALVGDIRSARTGRNNNPHSNHEEGASERVYSTSARAAAPGEGTQLSICYKMERCRSVYFILSCVHFL